MGEEGGGPNTSTHLLRDFGSLLGRKVGHGRVEFLNNKLFAVNFSLHEPHDGVGAPAQRLDLLVLVHSRKRRGTTACRARKQEPNT